MRKIAKFGLIIVFVGICMVLLFAGLKTAISSVEKQECIEWIYQSVQYPNFQWAEWQIDQCQHYGYAVDKLIK